MRLPIAVVVSSAIPQDNVEILHAKSVGVPVYKRDYWLAKLTENYNLIAVSGSHGKSTTASMLAYVLKAIGDDLTAVVGACVPQFPDGSIILGSVAIVTNLDWEHVDIFQDEEAVKSAFRRFLKQIRAGGHLVLCGDSCLVAMKDDFAAAFDDADQVVVTKVHAARETNDWSISGRDLAASIIGTPSEYIPSLGDVVDRLVHQISKDPHREIVVLTLGAGDITTVGPKLLHELQNRIQNVNSWLASIDSERLEFL
ncbi:hypothetical protein LWI29_026760 [Acer saccharum]|uniref:Mur ligase central domain-containing protein n=1 Tax=Acer saccharum TaxID=4024 RepID=A0AA39SUX1_ACESA|nr:hypothetical protein LWI29_026760 [Acer saccharum]